jgi:hypothetical protein
MDPPVSREVNVPDENSGNASTDHFPEGPGGFRAVPSTIQHSNVDMSPFLFGSRSLDLASTYGLSNPAQDHAVPHGPTFPYSVPGVLPQLSGHELPPAASDPNFRSTETGGSMALEAALVQASGTSADQQWPLFPEPALSHPFIPSDTPENIASDFKPTDQIESLMSWDDISFFLSLFINHQHILVPLVHKPSFAQDVLMRRDRTDITFRCLLISMGESSASAISTPQANRTVSYT